MYHQNSRVQQSRPSYSTFVIKPDRFDNQSAAGARISIIRANNVDRSYSLLSLSFAFKHRCHNEIILGEWNYDSFYYIIHTVQYGCMWTTGVRACGTIFYNLQFSQDRKPFCEVYYQSTKCESDRTEPQFVRRVVKFYNDGKNTQTA
jgi:hypothetical protein